MFSTFECREVRDCFVLAVWEVVDSWAQYLLDTAGN